MRYKTNYKQEKRQELLEKTGQLVKKNGFQTTGVDQLMQAANMTSGAFYSHFSSKQDLFQALITAELERSISHWQSNPHNNVRDWIEFEMQRYLHIQHVLHPDHGCPLPCLANEISRADDHIKNLYTQELMRGHALFAEHLNSEVKAWGVMCQMVGSLLMARSVHSTELQNNILNAGRWMILEALGLNDHDSL